MTNFELGQSFSNELLNNGNFIVMDMGSVSQEGNIIETKRTNICRNILKKDDLIMPKDDIGGGFIIGKTAHIPIDNKYVLGDHVYKLRFSSNFGLFIHYQINSQRFNGSIKKKVTGSAQLGLKQSNLESEILFLPTYDEQHQIGKFFQKVDTLITLHQRKHFSVIFKKKLNFF